MRKSDENTRLRVSNLAKAITNKELQVLLKLNKTIFSEIGKLKRCGIRWDRLGNSLGTADIEYFSNEDAAKAIRSFDSIENWLFRC